MRTTRKVTVSLPADMAEHAAPRARREDRNVGADDPFSDERITKIIEDAKRNPMTPDEDEAEFRSLAEYGAKQAKKLGIKERDIPEIIHRFRARTRAS
jgi:hypothetical protein